jgi:hypothetical protein
MTARINVPCNGNGGTHSVNKVADTITFGTSGKCSFISFGFDGYPAPSYPPGFSNRQPPTGGGATISYQYDGTPMPTGGYAFSYTTSADLGNGSGVIKNT